VTGIACLFAAPLIWEAFDALVLQGLRWQESGLQFAVGTSLDPRSFIWPHHFPSWTAFWMGPEVLAEAQAEAGGTFQGRVAPTS